MGDLIGDLEKLGELRKLGVLTDDEFELAKARRIESESASTTPTVSPPRANSVVCTACGSVQSAAKRFCGQCGAPLSFACPFCGSENPLGTRFCSDCGSDMTLSPSPGLSLVQARQWREAFQSIGWWDNPEEPVAYGERGLRSYLQDLHLPASPDDMDSYWVFCCRIMKRDHGISEVLLNGRAIATGWRQTPVQYLVGTRQSIVFFNLNQKQASIGRFAELEAIDSSGMRVKLTFSNLRVDFQVIAKGPGVLNFLMAFDDNSGSRTIAHQNHQEALARRLEVNSVVGGFLTDVGIFVQSLGKT